MSEVKLRAETGRATGTRASRRLRREGKVPATLYGQEADPVSVAVDARALRSALTTEAGLNAVIRLRVGRETHHSLARQLQRHPTKGDITHVDFVKISLTDRVDAVVSVELVGDPVGVRDQGGIVETVSNTVHVHTLVTAIPESIRVDVSALHAGDSIRVADLPTLDGVDYLDDPDQPVVAISLPAAVLAEEDESPEGEADEGEPVAPAEAAAGSAT